MQDGRVVGLVTLHELRDTPVEARATTPVERVMVALGVQLVVDPETPVIDVLNRMVTGGAKQIRSSLGGGERWTS